MTRRIGRAVGLDHRSRRPFPADEQLDQVHEQGRQRLGKGEGEQRRAPARDQEHEPDADDGEPSQDAVTEGIEDKREMRPPGSLGVSHQLRPPHVDPERPGGDEETTPARRVRSGRSRIGRSREDGRGASRRLLAQKPSRDRGRHRHFILGHVHGSRQTATAPSCRSDAFRTDSMRGDDSGERIAEAGDPFGEVDM